MSNKLLKLHLGCGEKYLEGYVNVDFPDSEQKIIKTKADVFSDMRSLSYPKGSVDEIRSHHLFEHFSRSEALKLLTRWRSWLKPGGALIIETPDFTTSARFFLMTFSRRRKYQLSRHIFGSEEAQWATHKDFWDKEKFSYVLRALGFCDLKITRFWNGLSKHAGKIPRLGSVLKKTPEWAYVPLLNFIGDFFPEKFYEKHGSNKMPNILVKATKNNLEIDEEAIVKSILSLYLVGKEGPEMSEVWMEDYRNF